MWQQRIETVRDGGTAAVADVVMTRYFHDGFRSTHAATVARFRRRLLATGTEGYIGCCAAVAAVDTTARLPDIAIPVLLIAGELDAGTPPAMAERMAALLPRAELRLLREASHISVIEQPAAFATLVQEFLSRLY